MNEKLTKPYNPEETEEKIYKTWEESGFFKPENLPSDRKGPYTIALPPPNVTGALHMGHALNATIQDILIRKKRMEGYKTLWIPGTDHAGIATQNVVEKKLKKEGLSRHDLGKEKFIEKVWEWKEESGNKILSQLKRIGASCDWSRTAFTMDNSYAKAVETTFNHYHKKGWIYQGDRVINWCKRCQTSLSDLELEYEDEKGKLYYIKYPYSEDKTKFLVVATTRPETMFGDSAVAVNPKDERYKGLIGKTIILPVVEKEIPVIADSAVEKDFGTGAVKITPAHDMLDAEIAERHNLPFYQIIGTYGKMILQEAQDKNPDLKMPAEIIKEIDGLTTKDTRQKLVEKLVEQNLIEKIEDYDHRVSKCYRCNSVIEPQISKQWFLKMGELAKIAKEAVKNGEVNFHPKRWEKVYFDWLDNIKDWCISRQIWWGHKIPIDGVDDVLDTWFSSALWPIATLGWPKENAKDLNEFYPTQVLSTARDIINLWVARMIFSGIEFTKEKPFTDILIHPTIMAKDGRRMSKSLGTGIDPLALIEKYGSDAIRFGLIFQMMGGQDIRFSEDSMMAGKKFANKIWNASRFVLMQTEESKVKVPKQKPEAKKEINKDILKKLELTQKSVNQNIDEYKFGHAMREIYDFFWHTFCDVYIEQAKNSDTQETKEILLYVLAQSIKILHPFMPFITEELWSFLPQENKNLLIVEKWQE